MAGSQAFKLLIALGLLANYAGSSGAFAETRSGPAERTESPGPAATPAEALPVKAAPAEARVHTVEAGISADAEEVHAYYALGRARLESGDAVGALEALGKTLELLEQTEPASSPRLVQPLFDVAQAYVLAGEHDKAILAMQDAIAIERRSSGLFSSRQLAMLDRLSDSFESVGDIDGADYARRYSVRIVEQNFGADDPQVIPSLVMLAGWFERTGRYAMARDLYDRIARIDSRESGGRSVTTVNALLGVGRTHRLEYVETPELVEQGMWGSRPRTKFDPVTGKRQAIAGAVDRPGLKATARLNARGKKALLEGLEILDSVGNPPPDLRARALMEIGDWYLTDREAEIALSYYRRAWLVFEELSPGDEDNPLRSPRPLFYRPPKQLRPDPEGALNRFTERRAEFSFAVSDRGEISRVVRVGGDMSEGYGWKVARALGRATFSPRFENGEPVATEKLIYVATQWEPVPDSQSSAEPAD